MPAIAHIANLWTFVHHPSPAKEWSLAQKLKACAAAGFDGITTVLTPQHRKLCGKFGLQHLIGVISSSDPAEFAVRLREQKEAGAVHMNIQLDDHDTPPAIACRHWIQLVREAEKLGGVIPALEVHRDCCTETPEKTREIAERFARATGEIIKINFDYSHFAVVKHLNPTNYVARLIDPFRELLQNGEQSHCRPFNGHHCQVPVTLDACQHRSETHLLPPV